MADGDFSFTGLALSPFTTGAIGDGNETVPVTAVDPFNHATDNRPADQTLSNQTPTLLNSLLNAGVQLGTTVLSNQQKTTVAKQNAAVAQANVSTTSNVALYAVGAVVLIIVAILLFRRS